MTDKASPPAKKQPAKKPAWKAPARKPAGPDVNEVALRVFNYWLRKEPDDQVETAARKAFETAEVFCKVAASRGKKAKADKA